MRAEKWPPTRIICLKRKVCWTGRALCELRVGRSLTPHAREPAVIEIFSRGLHPQHWHMASRIAEEGEAYLEVSRKEATLSDADNILRGLYRTHV